MVILLQCPQVLLSQDSWVLTTWNNQNSSGIQMLKQGKEVVLLPQALNLKDLNGETIKKSIHVGNYIIHQFTNDAIVGINNNNRERYQLLIGKAKNIYRIDANNLGFDLDDNNYGYALTLENGSARPIISAGSQMVPNNDVRAFYDSKNKSKHYDISKYVSDMRDYFKNLRKGAFSKAYKNRQDILKRANKAAYGIEADFYNPHNPFIQALYPIWQLADALLNCRPNDYSEISERPDYLTALSEVSEVVKKKQLINEANQFFQLDGAFSSVDEIRSIVEKALLELTFKENTEESYDRLLANITDLGYIKQATTAQEKVAYNSIYHSDDLSECERYLAKYKNVDATHYDNIEKLRYELAYKKLDFTTEACKKYLEDYPNSYYTSMVKERLYKCAYHDLDQTAAACHQYMTDYPASPYIEEVRNNLYKYAFYELGDSLVDYQNYIELYPNSPYYEEVKQKLEVLTYYDAIEKDEIEVYDEFLEKYPSSSYYDDIVQHRSNLISYDAEDAEDTEDYEIVWDVSSDEYESDDDNNKTSTPRKRSNTSKKRNNKVVTKGKKKTTTQQTTTKTTKTTNNDASKKANSLIFGPDN